MLVNSKVKVGGHPSKPRMQGPTAEEEAGVGMAVLAVTFLL